MVRPLFLLLLLSSFALSAQSPSASLMQILEDRFGNEAYGINALIAQDGKIVFQYANGMADVKKGIKMRENEVFRIGSITKQFTATAILQLIQHNRIDLQDAIGTILDDLPDDKASITIEQLLTHTSGMGSQRDIDHWDHHMIRLDSNPAIRDSIRQMYLNASLAFAPGTGYQYSNFGYFILGNIIEKVSEISYEQYLDQHIFHPLGMKQTSYEDSTHQPTVTGHSTNNDGIHLAANLNMQIPFAGGGMISTAQDLLRWNKALSAGHVINPSLLSSATSSHQLSDASYIPYGYGWMIGKIRDAGTVKHDGIINGFTSMAINVPEEDLYVVLLSNCDCSRDIEYTASLLVDNLLTERHSSLERAPAAADADFLISLSGSYQDEDGNAMLLSYQDGTLMYHRKGGSKEALIQADEVLFQFSSNELTTLEFLADSAGNFSSYRFQDLGLGQHFQRVDQEHLVLQSVTLDHEEMASLLGQYEFPVGFTLELLLEENRLYGEVHGDRKELRALGANRLYAVADDIQLHISEENGQTILTLHQEMEMQALKK